MKKENGSVRLNEAFQYVEDKYLDITEQEKGCRKGKTAWIYISIAAACFFLFLVLPVGAMANNWFGLQNLLLRGQREEPLQEEDSKENVSKGKNSKEESLDEEYSNEEQYDEKFAWSIIGLSGYQNSPEAQALAEWEEFLSNYDADHQILDAIGNDIFIARGREDWFLYGVYAQEMGEKLDEIVKKYGLKLHTQMDIISPEELEYRVGGEFLGEGLTKYWGYIYEDGTFQFDGDGSGGADFQLRRAVKGTFDEVTLNIGQVENYVEWQYTTACGEPVLLGLSADKSLIFADFEDCFISVNVLGDMTEEGLEEMADKIDFVLLKNVRVPDMRGDSVVSEE